MSEAVLFYTPHSVAARRRVASCSPRSRSCARPRNPHVAGQIVRAHHRPVL